MTRTPGRATGDGRITAVLGPTNTGKTHFAVERMLASKSGMIGFPLRLLARENYDRVVREKGVAAAALITGEERIVPPGARWFMCTVESMPADREVAFLGVDEVQLAADPERGHVFTDRILHARGREETMFMGADTVARLLRRLVPRAEIVRRPRLSTLSWAGHRRLARLVPRSAVVAFSAGDVYALGEQIRRRRGGAAIVMGALSPRTRNAQVAMYEAGEVDYIVATDAIGMGLNLDVRHVAFAGLGKFDGHSPRPLTAAEIAQIAGRAGRYSRDGSFGTTGSVRPPDEETIARVVNHEFQALDHLYWRNGELDFSSPGALRQSLEARPPEPFLRRPRDAGDLLALAALAGREEITTLAARPADVALLWEVCGIPDFRKIVSDHHTRLLGQVYLHLMAGDGCLPADWVAGHVARIDRTDGEIESIMARIADIRTWTYISHRSGWLEDPGHWQERSRAIEDRLSDALHERLTQRFVDRRAASLVRRMRDGVPLLAVVTRRGEVLLDGEPAGLLEGFRFRSAGLAGGDGAAGELDGTLRNAALQALRVDVVARVDRLMADDNGCFRLAADGHILWRGAAVGRLVAGPHPLEPGLAVLPAELLTSPLAERVRQRLAGWFASHARRRLAPLFLLRDMLDGDDMPGGALRGVLYQICEGLGQVARPGVAAQLRALTKAERARLVEYGIRTGARSLWLPALTKPGAVALRAVLAALVAGIQPRAAPDAVLVRVAEGTPEAWYGHCGWRVIDGRAVRIGRLEKLAARASRLARQGPFAPTEALAEIVGGGEGHLLAILRGLGFGLRREDGETTILPRGAGRRADGGRTTGREGKPGKAGETPGDGAAKTTGRAARSKAGKSGAGKARRPPPQPRQRQPDPDSPFAVLRVLIDGRDGA